MAILLRKIQNPNNQVEHLLNDLTDAVRRIVNFTATGDGVSTIQTPSGTAVSISNTSKARRMYIAEVVDDADGGGHYNCFLQSFDADDWNTDNDPLSNTGDSLVVLNLAEVGADRHALGAGNHIICWKIADDEGNTRLIGLGWVEVDNVLVEFNIDTGTNKFQTKKHDKVAVLALGAKSAYIDEHTGTECS